MPLLPKDIAKRAFYLITAIAPQGMEEFFFYIAKNYFGLNEIEKQLKFDAFKGNEIDFKPPDPEMAYKATIFERAQSIAEPNQSLIPYVSA